MRLGEKTHKIPSSWNLTYPGVDVLSTYPGNQYVTLSGTSMSTPHVSGVAALLFSYQHNASLEEVFNAMACSAVDVGSPGYDPVYGFGIVDALGALMQLNSSSPCVPNRTTTTSSSGMGGGPGGAGGGGQKNSNNAGSCVSVDATIQTDNNGNQDSFSLISASGQVIWMKQNLASNHVYKEHSCVNPNGCYQFQISDSGGDGIQGGGVTLSYDGNVLYSGGNFGSGGWLNMGGGCGL